MLNTRTVYDKIYNLYNQVKLDNIPVGAALRRTQGILAEAENENTQPFIDSWESYVDVHDRTYFLNKLEAQYPTVKQDEIKFEHDDLGMSLEDAKVGAENAKNFMKNDIMDLMRMPAFNLIQYNTKKGAFEIANTGSLNVLLYDLKVMLKKEK